jgi:hypothetical protein
MSESGNDYRPTVDDVDRVRAPDRAAATDGAAEGDEG